VRQGGAGVGPAARRLVGCLLLAMAVVGCQSGPGGTAINGWVWPTPAPLPAGATAVLLDVASIPVDVRPDVEYAACPMALLLPVTPHVVPDDADHPIHYRSVADGHEIHVRWPVGFSARLNPALEIVAPDGKVIAQEGVPIEGMGGGYGSDDAFTVCLWPYVPTRVAGGSPAG
jgi:hypothetical protein